ncbi:hypothetical protein COH21_012843 [Aspergillus flavus]|nr:hypothetical protein COH21_012843 [Aspergillus flavus]
MSAPWIEKLSIRTDGFYSGSVNENWGEVDKDGFSRAKKLLFDKLCRDPDASFVDIEELSSDEIRPHGLKYRYTGDYTSEQTAPEHGHHDYDHSGHLIRWQGTRHYLFKLDFSVRER